MLKNKKFLIILIVILCVIGLLVGIFFFVGGNTKTKLLKNLKKEFKERATLTTNIKVSYSGEATDNYNNTVNFRLTGKYDAFTLKDTGLYGYKGTADVEGLNTLSYYTEGYADREPFNVYNYIISNGVLENYDVPLTYKVEIIQEELIDELLENGKQDKETVELGSTECYVISEEMDPVIAGQGLSSLLGDYSLLLGKETLLTVDPITVKFYFDVDSKNLIREEFLLKYFADEFGQYLTDIGVNRKTIIDSDLRVTVNINKIQEVPTISIPDSIIKKENTIEYQEPAEETVLDSEKQEETVETDYEETEEKILKVDVDKIKNTTENVLVNHVETDAEGDAVSTGFNNGDPYNRFFYDNTVKDYLLSGDYILYLSPSGVLSTKSPDDKSLYQIKDIINSTNKDTRYKLYYFADKTYTKEEFKNFVDSMSDSFKLKTYLDLSEMDYTDCTVENATFDGNYTGYVATFDYMHDNGMCNKTVCLDLHIPEAERDFIIIVRHDYAESGYVASNNYEEKIQLYSDGDEYTDIDNIIDDVVPTLCLYYKDQPIFPEEEVNYVAEKQKALNEVESEVIVSEKESEKSSLDIVKNDIGIGVG